MATIYSIEEERKSTRIGRAAFAASESRKAGFTMQDRALLERVKNVIVLTLDLDDEDVYTNYYTDVMAIKIKLVPVRFASKEFAECCDIIDEMCGVTPHVGDTKDVRIFTIPKMKKMA